MDWSLILTIAVQILTVGIVYGKLSTEHNVMRRDIDRLEKEIIDSRALREDLAVVKSQLANIQTCLNSLYREIHKPIENRGQE